MSSKYIQEIKEIRADLMYRYSSVKKVQECNNVQSRIRYFNFWGGLDFDAFWLSKFILSQTSFNKTNKSIAIFSTFGNRAALKRAKGDIRIFYTGENVRNRHLQYSDNMLSDRNLDLSLGFDYFVDERYMRFPLWLMYMFDPESSIDGLCNQIQSLRFPEITDRKEFCTMVASHDFNHIRENMVNHISKIDKVCCGGKFMHNDDSLKKRFGDVKHDYLRQFLFNICPENTNAYGYVTEKVFECIKAGCVPIYYGSYNKPEANILNHDAILFYDPSGDNSSLWKEIEYLYRHPKQMIEFMSQPRLLLSAEDSIIGLFKELSEKIEHIL